MLETLKRQGRILEYFYDNNMYDLHEVYKFLEKSNLSIPAREKIIGSVIINIYKKKLSGSDYITCELY